MVLNSPGTVDADYRGEVKVILINLGDEEFTINHGDRIAQAVMAPVAAKNIVKLTKVTEITNNTDRAEGGFGSTGLK
jgi:dUTP pyrophosphatase